MSKVSGDQDGDPKNFKEFQRRVIAFLKLPPETKPEDLGFCWEVLHDIVESNENFEFDFEELRLTSDYLMGAVLLSVFHKKKVVVFEPTAYYSYQAVSMYRKWKVHAPDLIIGPVNSVSFRDGGYPDVIFHHGRVFDIGKVPDHIRSVVQIFKGVDVPQDTRTLSALIARGHHEND